MTGYETLPCGCQIGTETIGDDKRFVMIPCSLDCEYYRYAIEETRRQGKPVVEIDTR